MKIFDCFIYSDEEMLLDVRLNTLSQYIDKFIIVEANYKHNGDKKGKNFDIEKFRKFKDKININFKKTNKTIYNGGEKGIRTLDTIARIHAFQACAFNHSATSPLF